ncbi:glycosyltransferase [Leuconostoc suionicum]|uniref:glycosyltransferase n=1 Tax=Leuconostoc suionicum TaxID=1511761 RepID=UPI003748DFBB
MPYKNEQESQLAVVLSSINNQIGINFDQIEVILVCDGGYKLKFMLVFDIFDNINIRYYYNLQSKGPGFSQQFGMDKALGQDYMCMDAGDQLHFTGALLEFFNIIKNSGNHEIIIARYIEQYRIKDGSFRYDTHPQNDWKASYGKWFSAKYIKCIGLRWLDNLRIYEDTYFVGLACELSADIYYKNSVVYTWLCNPNSIVRKKENKFYQQLHLWAYMNRNYFKFLKNKMSNRLQDDFNGYWVELFFKEQNYNPVDQSKYILQSQLILEENQKLWLVCQRNLIRNINKWAKKNKKYLNQDTKKVQIYLEKLNTMAQHGNNNATNDI